MEFVPCRARRFHDKRMLPYDRTIGNLVEWAAPFLCLFWLRCLTETASQL
jgi:hypothetical protein